ncbi:RsmE family RNA methyltransferase [Estrella lausannensis]|uniref:Ribosomal RNA small subunit methyltransferase E n=1 Tax=Estrella lausannensis TaxID=483423 RepID=A0A0H5DQY9_9BACT|nr:RsmE family RNA methyltransferase [Estrella lausannensis]CRX38039.1 putative RNA methyltransferase [Estrella lausannensis]
MPVNRFYVDRDLQKDAQVIIEGDEFYHLRDSTRTKPGEVVELINGRGFLAEGVVAEIKKAHASIEVKSSLFQDKEDGKIILIQGVPRMNRLDTIIEKATELGVTAIHLFMGDRSERKGLSESSLQRVDKIAIAATKQCGRLYLPEIATFDNLEQSVSHDDTTLFFGDVNPAAPLFVEEWNRIRPVGAIAFVIGPESGLSPAEEEFLKSRRAIGVKLAENILRTDTAPILAIGLVKHLCLMHK